MKSLLNWPTDLMITKRRELSRRNPIRSSHCHSRRRICQWRGPLSLMKKLPLERTVRLIHRRPAVRNIWIARSCLKISFTTSWSESILLNSETASFEHWKWSSECQLFIVTNYLRFMNICRTTCLSISSLSRRSSRRSSSPSSPGTSTTPTSSKSLTTKIGGLMWQCKYFFYIDYFPCIYESILRFWS